MVRSMIDIFAPEIMRQFVICGTLNLTLANSSADQFKEHSPGPHASIIIHGRATFLHLVVKPYFAFGETYMNG